MGDELATLPLIEPERAGSSSSQERTIPILQSHHDFKRAPFEEAPPTHLPIGFLFWFHILLLIILALVAVFTRSANLSDYDYKYYSGVYYFFSQEMTWKIFWRLVIFSFAGVAGSFIFLCICTVGVCTFPLISIWLSGLLSMIITGLVCALAVYGQMYFIGFVAFFIIIAMFIGLLYHAKRLNRTSKLYTLVLRECGKISIILWILIFFTSTIIYIIWGTIIAISFLCSQQFAVIHDFLGVLAVMYILFSWYWTTKVIKNTIGVIAGTIVGKWYFYQSSARDGLVTGLDGISCSLGSICLGSLLIPPVTFMESLGSLMSCPFLSCNFRNRSESDDKIYSQSNPYAYTHICIFGTTLFDAASDALNTFIRTGMKKVLNKAAIGIVCAFVAITCGSIGSLCAGIIGMYETDYGGTLIVIGFLTGFGLADVIVGILDACTLVLLMCACEDCSQLPTRTPYLERFLRNYYSRECYTILSSTG